MIFTAKNHSIYLVLKILHIDKSVNKDLVLLCVLKQIIEAKNRAKNLNLTALNQSKSL